MDRVCVRIVRPVSKDLEEEEEEEEKMNANRSVLSWGDVKSQGASEVV